MRPLAGLVIGVLVQAVGVLATSRLLSRPAPAWSSGLDFAADSGEPMSMTRAAAPAIAGVVEKAVETAGPGACIRYAVRRGLSDVASELVHGAGPQIWIPTPRCGAPR